MIGDQKKVNDALTEKQFIIAQGKVKSALADLQKKFQYYHTMMKIR